MSLYLYNGRFIGEEAFSLYLEWLNTNAEWTDDHVQDEGDYYVVFKPVDYDTFFENPYELRFIYDYHTKRIEKCYFRTAKEMLRMEEELNLLCNE